MTINEQYKLAKNSTFGESVRAEELGSHMAKNSEWGAVAYLGHSQYGTKGLKVEKNTSSYIYTGGSDNKVTIYTDNRKQSTTHNATGVYDMNGGAAEYVASYVYNPNTDHLTTNGGDQEGDLCDNTGTKRGESTAYKTVYAKGSSDSGSSNYEANAGKKGDAVYETSGSVDTKTGSWFSVYAIFPFESFPFFYRGGYYGFDGADTFAFDINSGLANSDRSFRPVLAF